MSNELVIQAGMWLPGVVRMELRGDLNAETFPVLETQFQEWFAKGVVSFVLQLSDLATLSNVGVGVLVGIVRTCQEHGGTVTLERPGSEVRKRLELGGIYNLLHVVHSTRDAIRQVTAARLPS